MATDPLNDHPIQSGGDLDSSGVESFNNEQVRRVASGKRIQVSLSAFTLVLTVALGAMMLWLVAGIFDTLTPSIRADLNWKAKHGALELAHTLEVGIAAEDRALVEPLASAYLNDPDVTGVVVLSSSDDVIFKYGMLPFSVGELFGEGHHSVADHGSAVSSWSEATIEGTQVGKVGLVVSLDRLRAGLELRRRVLWLLAVACVTGLTASLAFFQLWIGPLLRLVSGAFRSLERTTELALESTRVKSEFIANMSHEIRTPMNGVVGMAQLMMGTPMTPQQRRYVSTISTSADLLMAVINDILDFSKLEARKVRIRRVQFRLRELVEETIALMSAQAASKHLSLVVQVDQATPDHWFGDADRIRQILANLVSNAVKFTEVGEVAVRVSLISDTHQVRFEVSDTGIGIAASDQAKLFQPFWQVDGSLTRRHGGTGLGLIISRSFVELMGGKLEVSSKLGVGSLFAFLVPLEVAEAEPSEDLHVDRQTISSPRGVPESFAEQNAPDRKSSPILVVEDHPLNQEVMRDMMETLGYSFEIAADGLEALDKLATGGFRMVLMDCQMPNLDGYEATRRWRKSEEEQGLPRVPIVAVTAHAWDEERAKVAKAGMDDFLSKPVQLATLGPMLERWLKRSGSDRTSARSPESRASVPALLNPKVERSERMCTAFLEQARDDVDFIQEAAAVGDAEALRQRAHRLKGGALTFGADLLGDLAAEVEQLARAGVTDIGDRGARLEDLFQHTALAVTTPVQDSLEVR